jgi:hypothetical protein
MGHSMIQNTKSGKEDEEGANWLPFIIVFLVATLGMLIWLVWSWPRR